MNKFSFMKNLLYHFYLIISSQTSENFITKWYMYVYLDSWDSVA